jgi:hypothetical protein
MNKQYLPSICCSLLLLCACATGAAAIETEPEQNGNTVQPMPEFTPPDRSNIPAFTGADGAGRFTTGGAGGRVYTVTSLADDGSEGTLRWAIGKKEPRIIVFAVSGIIELTRTLTLNYGDVTIAGQTAPGDGICLKNHTFAVQADNVIIRFIRSRMGSEKVQKGDDAMNGTKARRGILIDHCSISWSTDECATFYDNRDFTLQWCIISESLVNSVHEKGAHGYGGIWGGQGASFHHNLLAHHSNRTPRLCGSRYTGKPEAEKVELFNNVIYNYGSEGAYGGEGGSYNLLNNYYKPGAYTATKSSYNRLFSAYADDGENENAEGTYGHFYLSGNVIDATCSRLSDKQRKNIAPVNADNSAGFILKHDFAPLSGVLAHTPYDIAEHRTLQSATDAYRDVLLYAGASLRRDATDARIVRETEQGTYTYEGSKGSTNGLIDMAGDVGGWEAYESLPAPKDSDGDGMPDEWEKQRGLNPDDASDGARYNLSREYTNVEVYLDSLVSYLYPAALQ